MTRSGLYSYNRLFFKVQSIVGHGVVSVEPFGVVLFVDDYPYMGGIILESLDIYLKILCLLASLSRQCAV